jgi:hypothetical protein
MEMAIDDFPGEGESVEDTGKAGETVDRWVESLGRPADGLVEHGKSLVYFGRSLLPPSKTLDQAGETLSRVSETIGMPIESLAGPSHTLANLGESLVRFTETVGSPGERGFISSASLQGFNDRGYRIPVARGGRDPDELLDPSEITDGFHLPFVKTEQESASAADYFQDPFAVFRQFHWNRRQGGQGFR